MVKPPLRALALVLSLFLALPLAACVFGGISAQQDADLRAVYARMKANDIAGIEAAFDPQFKKPSLGQGLQFMQGMIPPQTPKVRLLKGVSQPGPTPGSTDFGATYEFDYPSTAVLAQIEMRQDKAGKKTITVLQMRQDVVGVADQYAFHLGGKKYYQYLFLFLMALAPGLGVWGLVHLWRAPDIKWKFLWAIAMCIGFMDLTMDWKAGDVFLNVVNLHILWVTGKQLGPLSPWMLTTSIPLASIAFLLGYRGQRMPRPWDGPKTPD